MVSVEKKRKVLNFSGSKKKYKLGAFARCLLFPKEIKQKLLRCPGLEIRGKFRKI